MITIKGFRAVRPVAGMELQVSCPPYDVIDTEEALEFSKENDSSFLHVTRSEIDLPQSDPYAKEVYKKAKENLDRLIAEGILAQDDEESFYLYQQERKGKIQLGLVACCSIDDYIEQRIKVHELTRTEKEIDRIQHFYHSNANTEPVFLFYKENETLLHFLHSLVKKNDPLYTILTEDGVRHSLWKISDESEILRIVSLFQSMDSLYIADGHHRTASAAKVGRIKREENPDFSGKEEFNFFMSVIFSASELFIMPYNRVLKAPSHFEIGTFLDMLDEYFLITPLSSRLEPDKEHQFTLLTKDSAYRLECRTELLQNKDTVQSLDVSILQNHVLSPLLGIKDPKTDPNIAFYGGETMMEQIEQRLQSDLDIAFLLFPTDIQSIAEVSDQNKIMPPKSTWFEPKLRSGLFVHLF